MLVNDRAMVGIVPQEDVVHAELSVNERTFFVHRKALRCTAVPWRSLLLRFPYRRWPLFKAKRYTNMEILLAGKLTDEDLDFIGVTLPIQRRILKESIGADKM